MAEKKGYPKFLETKYFGLIIGFAVFLILFGFTFGTVLISNIEQKMLDFNFRLKNTFTRSRIQEGVSLVQRNPKMSPDIMIVGIDEKSLSRFGRWPFPRYRHADLMDAFARIKNQRERERALFIDVFFIEPSEVAENDALLISSIKSNGHIFLETVLNLDESPASADEFFARQDVLDSRIGTIKNVKGDWIKVTTFLGVQGPLKPYANATYRYGHANFREDPDQVYRRQPLVVKLSRLIGEIPLDELKVDEPLDRANFERLAWIDKQSQVHEVPYPLTPAVLQDLARQMRRLAPPKAVDTNNDSEPDTYYYVVRKYRDTFLPSITLSLALEYMHKKMSDIEVVLDKYIRVPSPESFNMETQQWEPYKLTIVPPQYDADGNLTKEGAYRVVPEMRIPIDATGAMLINFMGPRSSANPDEHQTFPVRSYAGYAASPPPPDPARWPPTKKVGNMILMVGPFAQGMAADEKPTPFGLMFGVEIHANALNTILMGNFLNYAKPWLNALILLCLVMLTSLMVSRLSTIWSLVVTLAAILLFFFSYLLVFEVRQFVLTFTAPAGGVFLSFLAVVTYRTMTEERDKRRIRDMFGKYVSPAVVDEILQNPPELGGVDKEITVFFSDIRGFTTLSESLTPQELVNHLNLYLSAMTDLILDYTGTLDKYVGDEIMCFWGAPLPQPEHALLACKCALKQIEVLNKMNAAWPEEKRISIGIGVNTGIMTVGNMGSIGRMNYTLMGDMCNLGARLEGTNKQYFTTIIISEFTYAQVKDRVIAREMDNIRVKGKNKPVLIYELIDVIEGLEPPKKEPVRGMAGARA